MTERIKKIAAILVIGVMMLGLAACGSKTDTKTTDASTDTKTTDAGTDTEEGSDNENKDKELKTVRLGIPGSEDSFILLESGNVALYEGYFEEELNAVGYTLEPKYFAGVGPEINEAMASGELDVAIYGDLPIFVTKANGIDTTVVASVNAELQLGVLALDDSIQEPKDLEGKRVIVMQGTVAQNFWEKYVEANGIDKDKVEVINSADSSSLLLSGDADAYVANTYGLYVYINQGLGRLLDNSAEVPYGYSVQLVTVKTDYLEKNPEVAVAFNKALLRAYEAIKENPQLLYDDSDTPTFSADLWEQVYSYDTSFEYMNPEVTDTEYGYLENFNQWLYDNGMISEKVDLDNLIDTSYYKQAIAEIGG